MVIVFNPVAGRRRALLLWRVLDVLVEHGIRLDVVRTTARGDAERIAREACLAGESLVVAAGGDGTISEVANGVLGTGSALGVIPLGTANVLAHEIGLSFSPRAIATALAFRRTRPLWPGVATTPDGQRLFVQMLGAGFDAEVVHRLWTPLKAACGRGAYVMQAAREAIRYEFPPIRVHIEGSAMEAASLIVSNGRLYGGPYTLAPRASPHTPGFWVTLFECSGPLRALGYGAMLPLQALARSPGVRQLPARWVEIRGNRPVPVQTDGDDAGVTPIVVANASEPIPLVVS